jgi:hypothetical protein
MPLVLSGLCGTLLTGRRRGNRLVHPGAGRRIRLYVASPPPGLITIRAPIVLLDQSAVSRGCVLPWGQARVRSEWLRLRMWEAGPSLVACPT